MEVNRTGWLLAAVILLGLSGVSPGYSEERASEALHNQDVVKMVAAGLSEAVVVAKIREAKSVDFALEVDDLIELKASGVSAVVIEAMLGGGDDSVFSTGSSVAGSALAANPLGFMSDDLGHETIRVALETDEGKKLIRAQRGEFSTTAMGMLAFFDYPGLKAMLRTTDRRPSLLVKSKSQLSGGRYFWAKLDSDKRNGVRSLKISSAKGRLKATFGNSRRASEPDHDWVLPYSVEELGDDLWRVTPEADLEPGEYGWYVDLGTGSQQSCIFDFGVD